ncbi:HAMP domain-containing histidine kinase [Micrococcales bacterium 31B]|nr:HAMP domain-containing histidine kinase [Micrococcales bacterium 31B]
MTSLWTRIITTMAVLIAVGVGLVGVGSVVLLQRTLIEKVDQQLEELLPGVRLPDDFAQLQAVDSAAYGQQPSPYTVVVTPDPASGLPTQAFGSAVNAQDIQPLGGTAALGRRSQPFTVELTDGSEYRALSTVRRMNYTQGEFTGILTVTVTLMLPLDYTHSTVQELTLLIIVVGVIVVTLGIIIGGYATHRSLRPLREVEKTAADIAAGDLSRRVPTTNTSLEVARLSDSLNEMLMQIEMGFADRMRSEERMRRFVADASHELRTPLAAIRGFGELHRIGALPDNDAVTSAMRRIEDEAIRMGSLVEDLLRLARLDEKPEPVSLQPVDFTVLATDASGDLRALDPTRRVRVTALLESDEVRPCYAVGDENMLRQVVTNLMGNTARHTEAGTPVEFAVGVAPVNSRGEPGPVAVLEVRDHGPGIDPSHARKVFERFYRTDSSRVREGRGRGGGAGLGLAIVDSIVTSHHGCIAVNPTPGGGATFRLEIPAYDTRGQDASALLGS